MHSEASQIAYTDTSYHRHTLRSCLQPRPFPRYKFVLRPEVTSPTCSNYTPNYWKTSTALSHSQNTIKPLPMIHQSASPFMSAGTARILSLSDDLLWAPVIPGGRTAIHWTPTELRARSRCLLRVRQLQLPTLVVSLQRMSVSIITCREWYVADSIDRSSGSPSMRSTAQGASRCTMISTLRRGHLSLSGTMTKLSRRCLLL